MAPRVHSRRGLRRAAEEWAETLAPWTSYSVLLVVVLLLDKLMQLLIVE